MTDSALQPVEVVYRCQLHHLQRHVNFVTGLFSGGGRGWAGEAGLFSISKGYRLGGVGRRTMTTTVRRRSRASYLGNVD